MDPPHDTSPQLPHQHDTSPQLPHQHDTSPQLPHQQNQAEKPANNFTPRSYQTEMLERVIEKNSIICMGTGTGKTFIAIMLIKEMAYQTQKQYGDKRTFFLVNQVDLAKQQGYVIKQHVNVNVRTYVGADGVDEWYAQPGKWEKELEQNQVLIMTAQILLDLLSHGVIDFSRINLIIFDECHHAQKSHQYKLIMDIGKNTPAEKRPHILGLTASIVNQDAKSVEILEQGIAALEATLTSTAMTSNDFVAMDKFGTKPSEKFVPYDEYVDTTGLVERADAILNNGLRYVNLCKEVYDKKIKEVADNPELAGIQNQFGFGEIPRGLKLCLKALEDCQFILHDLGPWAAACVASHFVRQLMKGEKCPETPVEVNKGFFELGLTILRQVHYVHQVYYEENVVDLETMYTLMSPKVRSFVEKVLYQFKNDALTGIVFVERRNSAFVLNKVIDHICMWDENLYFIKCSYMVGGGSKGLSKEEITSSKRQEQTLQKFRNKKEINLLIATSVLQEGIDLPKCNLVTLFDVPKNYREHVQAKGRARAASSKFYMLTTSKDLSKNTQIIENYRRFEGVIAQKCLSRDDVPDEVFEKAPDEYLPAYKPVVPEGQPQPQVSMSSAVNLINLYCSMLHSDRFTRLVPTSKFEEKTDDNNRTWFICTLQLPINSLLKESIVGAPMPRKKLAQMAAALKACERLHKLGELNDYLLPAGKEHEEIDESVPGNLTTKQLYRKRVSEYLTGHIVSNEPCCLYLVKMLPKFQEKGKVSHPPRSFGFLLKKKLPRLPDFSVFATSGEMTVTLELIRDDLLLNEEELDNLSGFHRYIFQVFLHLEKDPMKFQLENSLIIVPLNHRDENEAPVIDWPFVRLITANRTPHHEGEILPDLNDAVVTPVYCNIDKPQYFYVTKTRHDLNPNSQFQTEDTSCSFEEYFKLKYSLEIRDKNQPMLDVEPVDDRLNLLRPLTEHVHKNQIFVPELCKVHLLPELCKVHLLPGSLWPQGLCLPSIIYRLNHLLIANQLRSKIVSEAGIGVHNVLESVHPALDSHFHVQGNLRAKDKVEEGELVEMMELSDPDEFKSTEHTKTELSKRRSDIAEIEKLNLFSDYEDGSQYGPSPCAILQTLTMCKANDLFDLERLEMIGDSFLKFAVTVHLYTQYPRVNEGKLNAKRQRQIENKNLFRIGREKGLAECLISTRFDPNKNWLPPGYTVEEIVHHSDQEVTTMEVDLSQIPSEGGIEISQLTHHSISGKSIADSVEALIGCYLITCGIQPALNVMSWLGLEVSNPHKVHLNPPVFTQTPEYNLKLQILTSGMDRFEDKINYKFKDRGYLLQALTHASYYYNRITDSYQRLEFLGDAVLDYVITRFLFQDPKRYAPGELTELRSGLVNNKIFAKLAVKFDFHQSFKYLSSDLYTLIHGFVTYQKERGDKIDLDENYDDESRKCLADVFESVAGAIYLDSGLSLDTVWRVYYRMMKPQIEEAILRKV